MRFHSLSLSCALALSLFTYSFSMWVRVAQRASNVCLYSGGSEAAFGQGASGSPLTPPHRTEAGWKVNGTGAGACGTWRRAQIERERERESERETFNILSLIRSRKYNLPLAEYAYLAWLLSMNPWFKHHRKKKRQCYNSVTLSYTDSVTHHNSHVGSVSVTFLTNALTDQMRICSCAPLVLWMFTVTVIHSLTHSFVICFLQKWISVFP